MRIDNISIDRFGGRNHIALEGLSDQVNVVYGPNGSGKSTIIQFLKWALFGNSDEVGATYARETSGQAAGSIGFTQDGRRRTINRRDDGSRQGQWSVDGHLQSERIGVTSLMGSLTPNDFDLFFSPNFEQEPDIVPLLHAASSRGLELVSRRRPTQRIQELRLRIDNLRRESERLPWIGQELDHLVDHRSSLERRLVQYEDDYRRRRSSVDREYDELNRQIVDLESTITRLREQWHVKDRDVNARRMDLEEAWRTADEARRELIHRMRGELSDLENNLDRARGMLSEFQRRSARLDGDLRDREFDYSAFPFDKDETLCMVQSLSKQLDDLRSVPRTEADAPLYRSQFGTVPTVTAQASALESLRSEVGRLCKVMQADRDQEKARAMAGEQVQLRQCESEIERWVTQLVDQRNSMAKELEEAERFGVTLVVDDRLHDGRGEYGGYLPEVPSSPRRVRAVLHSCDGFEPIEPDADELLRRLTSDRDLVTRDLDLAERQLRQLLDRRRELELNLHRVQDHETAALRREIAEIDTKIRNAEERERLRREMERLEMELARVGDDVVPSQIVAHAADILGQLSGGRYVDLQINAGTVADIGSILVQEASGPMLPYAQLSRGIRDQVYLSLCLAMLSALRRQGIEMPLILNDPFINIDSDRDKAMAAVLSGFAANENQILLFTRHRRVTELFQPHQARYIELAPVLSARPVARPLVDEVRFRSYADGPRIDQPRIDERGAVSFRRHPEKNVSQYRSLPKRTPSSDEDSLRRPVSQPSFESHPDDVRSYSQTTPSGTLQGNVPLVNTGTIEPQAARQLAEVGIHTVDDLLRSSPDYIERESQRRGMPAGRPTQRWRDELSLRCMIPRLNERDARWLVSCGVTSVQALAAASVDALLNRLNGLSGSNYRVSRDVIEGWVRSSREYDRISHRNPRQSDPDRYAESSEPRYREYSSNRRSYPWEDYGDAPTAGATPQGRAAYPNVQDYRSEEFPSPVVPESTMIDSEYGQYEAEADRGSGRDYDNALDRSRSRRRSRLASNGSNYRVDRADRQPTGGIELPHVAAELAPSITRERDRQRDEFGTSHSRSNVARNAPDHDSSTHEPRDTVARRASNSSSGSSSSRSSTSRSSRSSRSERRSRSERDNASSRRTSGLRFYLNRADAIVDAPSIGPRTATKLKKIGITTVDQFLQMKSAEIAAKLSDNRITEETIADWQAQTVLACRIPQLRGHDAQILVACGVTNPEKLAAMDAKDLWGQVGPFAKSADGKRIIRGGKAPDLAEVADWIAWSKDARLIQNA